MPVTLPPVPVGEKENSYLWTQWYLKLEQLLNSEDGVAWILVDKTGSSLADLATRNHSDLQSMQGGTSGERYHLTLTQHTSLTALPTIAAGTWTPTLTNVTNVAASTVYDGQYLRVGATVTCSGKVDIDPTAAGATELGISLPVASNLANNEDCAGACTVLATVTGSAAILGDTTNNRASLQYIAVDTGNTTVFYTFTYQVI